MPEDIDRLTYRPIVDEAQVETALDVLLRSEDIAQARGDLVFAEKMLAHVKALAAKMSDERSAAAADRAAEASDEYKTAIDRLRDCAIAFEKAKARREWASMVIEVWRTLQATERSKRI